ncbi:alpha,alpha-phosphotrehalase [Suttonella ornithocola]|uniref:Alpha,alpha-phosphotrehalase n=1 Tax=Suttonella ornithocola TaxID=279832 RepID=A0A380N1J2_9GAMM|nr:alpha,alpha-phosphotrehalase [Suttonella ornithocola]SUO97771.1 Trehalose-6-phosphate hydrolase [Suttonella ornithocola]
MYFQDKVVYQIYPKSFKDTTGNGLGDINGITEKLDYLATLGVDYLWLCPIYPSPQNDNGYDVADYRAINPEYGTMADFERLCQEAKKRQIHIMLDMVFNHTSTEHQWFQKALAGEKEFQDYYLFKQGKNDKQPPNNWQSKFGGSAWEYVAQLDKWYLHLFDVTQADLNWENPKVRQEMAEIVNFWREKGVHGFRFDVVNLISKGSYEDDPNHFDGRQFYTDGPKVHQYLQELNQNSFGQDTESFTVGEMSSTTLPNCIRYSGKDTHELSSVFTFHHLKVDYKDGQKWQLKPFDFLELKRLMNDWQIGMAQANAWNALFWCNHDQPRAISRFGDDKNYPYQSATMLATTLHMMRGTPYIYQGEEIGMTNAYFTDIEQYRDIESLNIYRILREQGKSSEEIITILQARSRDNARTPMQWNAEKNAGFSLVKPWIQVNENYHKVNVEQALNDKNSIFYYYQNLIKLRKAYPVIQQGDYRPLLIEHPKIFSFRRQYKNQKLIVISNFYPEQIAIPLENRFLSDYKILFSNYSRKDFTNNKLASYETRVYYQE